MILEEQFPALGPSRFINHGFGTWVAWREVQTAPANGPPIFSAWV